MADFIEVHQLGKPRLVNLDWVEEIWPTENGTQIYFAFTCPDATSQDFITADESYDEIKRIIAYKRWMKEMPRRENFYDDVRDGNTIKLPREQEKNEWND